MTTVQITLPDQLAEEAAKAGLLAAEKIEALLREQLRAEASERLGEAMAKLDALNLPPMTTEEVQAEIKAYRAERRAGANADRR